MLWEYFPSLARIEPPFFQSGNYYSQQGRPANLRYVDDVKPTKDFHQNTVKSRPVSCISSCSLDWHTTWDFSTKAPFIFLPFICASQVTNSFKTPSEQRPDPRHAFFEVQVGPAFQIALYARAWLDFFPIFTSFEEKLWTRRTSAVLASSRWFLERKSTRPNRFATQLRLGSDAPTSPGSDSNPSVQRRGSIPPSVAGPSSEWTLISVAAPFKSACGIIWWCIGIFSSKFL